MFSTPATSTSCYNIVGVSILNVGRNRVAFFTPCLTEVVVHSTSVGPSFVRVKTTVFKNNNILCKIHDAFFFNYLPPTPPLFLDRCPLFMYDP